jgi:hypothetical protein
MWIISTKSWRMRSNNVNNSLQIRSKIDGQQVQVAYSMLDMGTVDQIFDGNENSLVRSMEANPLRLQLDFRAAAGNAGGIRLKLGVRRLAIGMWFCKMIRWPDIASRWKKCRTANHTESRRVGLGKRLMRSRISISDYQPGCRRTSARSLMGSYLQMSSSSPENRPSNRRRSIHAGGTYSLAAADLWQGC